MHRSRTGPRWVRALLPLAALFALIAAGACGGDDDRPAPTATATAATATATQPPPAEAGYLVAFDIAAEAIHVFKLPGMELTGSLEGMKFGNHNGAVVLDDGRILFSDDKNQELVALRIDAQGTPVVDGKAAADLGGGGIWSSLSEDQRYWVVSGGSEEGGATQPLNIWDLTTYRNVSMDVEMAAQEELHPWIAGDLLAAGVGGELRAWRLADALRGELGEPVATEIVGTGSHGLVITPARERLFISTRDGLEGVHYGDGDLDDVRVVPWNADGLDGGRNGRPRLSADGDWVYGAIARAGNPTEPERWAERINDVHMADIRNFAAKRMELGKGIVTRFQLSRPLAMFVTIHPDGDAATFIDVDPSSGTFQQVRGKVSLEPLAGGPKVGEPPSGKQSRAGAITPDGRWAFVSFGGEGKVVVIDTKALEVVATVSVPTPLTNGGYLLAVQPGAKTWDLVAR